MTDKVIATLVSRLEAVTARLESIEKQVASGGGHSSAPSSSGGEGGSSSSVQEYEDLIAQHIKPYVELSHKIGGVVASQADLVLQAVEAQRDFLKVVSVSKKPSDTVFMELLKPTQELLGKIATFKDKEAKSSPVFNNVAAVAEGINALGWVAVTPTPGPFIGETRPSAEFYSNRILKDFKGKDENQVSWVNHFIGFLKDLQPYVKKNHTTGTAWNPRGGDASSAAVSSGSSSAPPPPGPPPPPPPNFDAFAPPPSSEKKVDMGAVFSAINKGEGVTAGLKKVTNDMKTKNRTDKVAVVKASETKDLSETKGKKEEVAKPPKIALEGNKWTVEYQVNNKSIVIDDTEPKQTVYIYKCKGSTIQIKGKVNTVSLDGCSRTSVVFDDLVASFEIVNCTSVEVQVTGSVPTFLIDKTSGVQLYLSKASLGAEIVTSKSSEMNVLIPDDHNPDPTEIAIPEQYKTLVKNGKLETTTVQHI